MKTAIAIVLIVCGTFLVLTPYIYRAIATLLPQRPAQQAMEELPSYAPVICMLAGIVMVVLGGISGLRRGHSLSEK